MRDPEPRPVAETGAARESAQGRSRTLDAGLRDGEIDAGDPAVVDAAEVADRVCANA